MPQPWPSNPSILALPDHCEPSSQFLTIVSSFFHVCLPTPLALLSSTLGTLSIISWLFAQLPQIYKNYNLQSTSGLSAFFLVEWCLGDSSNLVGAVLTNQAGWQITIAGYYVFVDVILVAQYYWYTYIKKWSLPLPLYTRKPDENNGEEGLSSETPPLETGSAQQLPHARDIVASENKYQAPQNAQSGSTPSSSTSPKYSEKTRCSRTTKTTTRVPTGLTPLSSPKAIILVSMLCAVLANATSIPEINKPPIREPSANEIAGRIISWFSTLMYLASRLPQLIKNRRRKSTSGLSPLLFFAAFCGNLFYSTSLLTNPNGWFDFPPYGGGGWAGPRGNDRWEWVSLAAPFWLGAAGVLALDGAMGVQFLMYGEGNEEIVVGLTVPGRGRQRWNKVTGWMRGWIPSTSPTRNASSAETQSLLTHGIDRYGGV